MLVQGGGGGGGGGSTSFTPKALGGLALWLRADLGIHASGGHVSQWDDQSGLSDPGRNQVQATGANQPTFNSADGRYNGKATVQFSGAAVQWMQTSALWNPATYQPVTVICVGNDDGVGASTEGYLGDAAGIVAYLTALGAQYFASGDANLFAAEARTANPSIYYIENNDVIISPPSAPEHSTIAVSNVTPGAIGEIGGNTQNFKLVLGCKDGAGTDPLTGKIAEVIFYNRLLTASERLQVMRYLSTRYSIAIGP